MELELRLQKQQGVAFTSPATEILYGGSAGGGKSHLLRVAFISWALQVPGLQLYLFRRTFPELQQNHMEGPTSFRVLLAPLINAGKCRIVNNEIRFPKGSRIFLRHCQHEKDVYNYQGTEIHVLGIDELTHWPEFMYRYLRGRCRMTGIKIPKGFEGLFPRIVCGCNPGGIGHHWVKASFVDAEPLSLRRMPNEEGGMLRQFIPAKLSDNPALLRSDPDYRKKLEGLGDPVFVRSLLEGDWEVVAGAMFGATWRRSAHVCDPFPIPQHWRIWRGADDGYASPAACYWLAQNPDNKQVFVIREIYRAGMLPDDYAQRVLDGDQRIEIAVPRNGTELNTTRLSGVMDSAAFSDMGYGTGGQRVPSRGDAMNAKGCQWTPAEKPPGSRRHRVQDFHNRLAINEKTGKPGIVFFSTCKEAIRTIPTLPRDSSDAEDVDTDAEDHAFDAVTYGLQRIGTPFRKMLVKGT